MLREEFSQEGVSLVDAGCSSSWEAELSSRCIQRPKEPYHKDATFWFCPPTLCSRAESRSPASAFWLAGVAFLALPEQTECKSPTASSVSGRWQLGHVSGFRPQHFGWQAWHF